MMADAHMQSGLANESKPVAATKAFWSCCSRAHAASVHGSQRPQLHTRNLLCISTINAQHNFNSPHKLMTSSFTCSGVVLVASGELERSMFRRSVVLLYEHSARGARGVILSQPLHELDPRLAGSTGLGAPVSSRTLLRHFHGGPVGMLGVHLCCGAAGIKLPEEKKSSGHAC